MKNYFCFINDLFSIYKVYIYILVVKINSTKLNVSWCHDDIRLMSVYCVFKKYKIQDIDWLLFLILIEN